MQRRWMLTLGVGGAAAALSVPEVRYLHRLTAISASLREVPDAPTDGTRIQAHHEDARHESA